MIARPIVYSVRAARYFPMTMPPMETGAVRSPCSVFCFFSSLNKRMVSTGIRMVMTKNRLLNKLDISVVAIASDEPKKK